MTSNIDRGHSGTKRRNRNRPTAKPSNGPITVIKVAPLLWEHVGYSLDQLLVIDQTTVIVCNSRRHRDYMRKLVAR